MRNLAAIVVLTSLFAIGCKNKESMVPGTWKTPSGSCIAKEDKTFTFSVGPLTETGTWKMDGDDVVLTPLIVNGKTVQSIKQNAMARYSSLSEKARQVLDDLDKPDVLNLSDDGKTMTTDKAKDKNSGPPVTLTKSSS